MHIETYSEQLKPVKGSRDHFNSAAQVEGEAARDPLYSEHVDSPMPPQQVGGNLTISEFRAKRARLLSGITETVTQKDGSTYTRGLRKDAATLYTEIHSHPLTSEEYMADRARHGPPIKAWGQRVLADFKKRMPKGVDYTAVLHLDEGHVHIHILAMNTADPKLDANKLHAGKVAAALHREENASDVIPSLPKPELAKRPKKPKKPRPSKNRNTQKKNDTRHSAAVAAWEAECAEVEAGNKLLTDAWEAENKAHLQEARKERGRPSIQKVYTAAMKKLQDDYYEAVGKPCGLLRVGPRQARKSTKEYAAEKRDAKRLADDARRLEAQRKELAAKDAELIEQKAAHEAKVTALKQDRAALRRRELADKKARADWEKTRVEKENELLRREGELTEAVDAMGEIFEAVESGDADNVNGKLHMPRWPEIVSRIQGDERDSVSTPIRKLIEGFARLVMRVTKRVQDSDGPEVEVDEAPRFGG
ncbi:Mob protein [uncultured Sulfitobacter sp.]|uniref:Mob protein n=1 Tax=uncultured Sulfitobacter sp. TaxID=191468 RepID=UPI00260BE56D|nr:Mob protein [uncultured Sulfitobacter sp.]